MELSKRQEEIIANDNPIIFVDSAPASGKTRLIMAKIEKELKEEKGKVVAFTFTNAAAEEMMERIGEFDKDKLFIGTIHSYCLKLLLENHLTKALDYVNDEEFDRLFDLIKQHQECIKPVYCVICDETQDCNSKQFEFIFEMLKSEKRFVCYDKRQSIYRWRDAHPEQIDKYAEIYNADKEYMNENYRNKTEILDFAKNIIRSAGESYIDYSIPTKGEGGRVVTVDYSPEAIARTIKRMGNYKDWFVLTRTNDQSEEITRVLKKHDVPCDSFKRSEIGLDDLRKKMKDETVKVLTIHSAKGLENINVVVIGARFYNLEERCVSYVAATRAKDLLVWATIPNKPKRMQMVSNWEK